MGPHFLWHGRLTTKGHEPSEQLSTIWDPPWAGWTADVATATHFREIFPAPLALDRIQKRNTTLSPHFILNVLQIQNLQPFFLQGTHWTGRNSHQTVMLYHHSRDILTETQQRNSHIAECPNTLWSGTRIFLYAGVQIWKPGPGNSLQGSHYNIMPITTNKNLELTTQKCELGSLGATALIWLQKI